MRGKEIQFMKLQILGNVSRSRKKKTKTVMQMYITFGPNLTSSRVHLLPQSSLPSFSLHQVFPRYKKENTDLHNLKKSETTASGTGMVPFFSHSLKFTV